VPPPGIYFATEPDGFLTADKVILFLQDLLKHLRRPFTVVWYRGGNHKGPLMREFLLRTRRLRLRLEMLPPWAPELNPVEPIWSWLKKGELANYSPDDADVLDEKNPGSAGQSEVRSGTVEGVVESNRSVVPGENASRALLSSDAVGEAQIHYAGQGRHHREPRVRGRQNHDYETSRPQSDSRQPRQVKDGIPFCIFSKTAVASRQSSAGIAALEQCLQHDEYTHRFKRVGVMNIDLFCLSQRIME
jgi:transposase